MEPPATWPESWGGTATTTTRNDDHEAAAWLLGLARPPSASSSNDNGFATKALHLSEWSTAYVERSSNDANNGGIAGEVVLPMTTTTMDDNAPSSTTTIPDAISSSTVLPPSSYAMGDVGRDGMAMGGGTDAMEEVDAALAVARIRLPKAKRPMISGGGRVPSYPFSSSSYPSAPRGVGGGGGDNNDDWIVGGTTSSSSSSSSVSCSYHPSSYSYPSSQSSTTTGGEYYEEESAWRMHNPPFPHDSYERLTSLRRGDGGRGDDGYDVRERRYVGDEGGGGGGGGIVDGPAAVILPPHCRSISHLLPPPTHPRDLRPVPPPMPLLSSDRTLPNTGHCVWSYDESSRVLLADFRRAAYAAAATTNGEGDENGNGWKASVDETSFGAVRVTLEDEAFLLEMMERDDVTVISDGLADEINSAFWTREYIEGCIGSEYHHKFRSFETAAVDRYGGEEGRQQEQQLRENDGWYSMKFSDYFSYLQRREYAKGARLSSHASIHDVNGDGLEREFSFVDSHGKEITIDVENVVIYMIDVDATKLLPHAYEDFQRNFKLPGILPGGSHCMMNAVNANGRPFMGPNMYVTPPSSFTNFHQDGHGTVDSGHWCLSGYNEVVMLRRLTERHKCHAVQLLTGTSDSYGTLYGLPHRDGVKTRPGWPSKEAIGLCKQMGYCPSVFILKPGQVVHINKGRLHAFRKLAPSILHVTDCHYELRNAILQAKVQPTEDICFSIAWDWMFKGVTSEGINREVSSILECSRLNRQHLMQSLAIPETALLFLAKENISKNRIESKSGAGISPFARGRFGPDSLTVLRGILPSLEYVVTRHSSAVEFSKHWEQKTKNVKDSWCVLIDPKPNTWQDPQTFALDPYGAGDFFCKICAEELSNVYMHCDGCEKLLNKDFNICSGCHMDGKYKIFHQMHPFNPKSFSILNHTGNKLQLRQSRCPCKNGKECGYCGYCTGCSCRCHQRFTVHYRFMEQEKELELLQKAKDIVGSYTIPQIEETRLRLLSLISQSEVGVDNLTSNSVRKDDKAVSSDESRLGLPPQWSSLLVTTPDVSFDDKAKKEVTPPVNSESLRPLKKRSYPPKTTILSWNFSDDTGRQASNNPTKVQTALTLTPAGAEPMVVDGVFRGQTEVDHKASKVASVDTESGSQTYARQVSDKKPQVSDKKQILISFHCPHCDEDFNYTSAKTATASFSNHVRRCHMRGKESSVPLPRDVASDTVPAKVKSFADVRAKIDTHDLKIGSEVFVQCNQGKEWIATLLRPREKGGVNGFHIRYKGQKRRRKVSEEDWVPAFRVLRMCHG